MTVGGYSFMSKSRFGRLNGKFCADFLPLYVIRWPVTLLRGELNRCRVITS